MKNTDATSSPQRRESPLLPKTCPTSVSGAGVRGDFAQMDEGEHDAKHDQPAVEDAGHRQHTHGSTIVALVTATLNAGAVPAMPITADSKAPSEFPANPFLCDT